MRQTHILVVDDEPDIRVLMKEILEDEGFKVTVAENGATAKQQRQEQPPDLILLDIWMPDIDGITLLKEWQASGLMTSPVIIMSGHGTIETAVEATRLGAYDFIEKPVSISKLLVAIKRALEMATLQRENHRLRKTQVVVEPIGHSPAMVALREQIQRVHQHHTAVLIRGESGSGRTLVARHIHQHGPHYKEPFVQVRITGMTPDNQALELFGNHSNNQIARLEQANGGTLLIKDIVDMDLTMQGRLLSCLENQSFLPNGGNSQPIPINVRVIAATAYDPEQAVATGRLREDLYYYLNVIPLHLLPLREHCEDVPELLEFYVNFFVNQENLPYRRFTVAAQNRLRNYSWPGNVRELKNLVQRLLLLGNSYTIDLDEVEPTLNTQPRPVPSGNLSIYDLPLREAREQFEKAYLEHQLQEVGGNVSKVASKIGLERTHLYRKLRALEIEPKAAKK